MRIDPVYLVAPKPEKKKVPTRRAFLIAGGTFLAGLGLGGACGYAVGASGVQRAEEDEPLAPTGNAELDELRRLAVKAPVEELMGKATVFLDFLRGTYRSDPILWSGADRIANEVINNSGLPNRRVLATWLAQLIEAEASQHGHDRRDLASRLRRIR